MRDRHSPEEILFIVVTVVLTILILGSLMLMLLTDEVRIPRITFFAFGVMLNFLLAVNNLIRNQKRGYACIVIAVICAIMTVNSILAE